VKRILEEEGIHPLPTKARKKPPVEWATFVRAHVETLIACDFFTKPVYSGKSGLPQSLMTQGFTQCDENTATISLSRGRGVGVRGLRPTCFQSRDTETRS
jgi:hypothetical protein